MHRLAALAAATLALTLAAPVAAAELPTEPMSAQDAAAIDEAIAGVMAANPDVPAFYIGVWDPERGVYQQAYGLADIANEVPATVDDHFRIGSISKTFMATIMLQLVDEGVFGLDDTVASVTPKLAERFPPYADITVRQLLGMQSGVEDYMNVPDAAVAVVATENDTVFEPEQLVDYGIDAGVSAPGTPGYSTTNYILMQLMAEDLTGETIQKLIAERLTEPLGMPATALPPNEDTTLPAPQSHGYIFEACNQELVDDGAEPVEPGTDTTEWNASYGQSGGGMHSTIADLGVWAASLSGTELLSDETAAERLEVEDIRIGAPYGLGIMQLGTELGHEGEAIGWEGWAGHDPDSGVTSVIFTNTCHDSGALFGAMQATDPASYAALFG
ncbi:MAG: serine hydrolase domain-containing protein, partial [Candidatus Limnocylindrales bacterium]